jgi:formate/nitrite transporter FocA (FNT family)
MAVKRPKDEAEAGEDETGPKAGASSPHLDEREQDQAARHAAPPALVIHEVVREEGETELSRSASTLIWSGLAAGLSMGFSLLAMALLRAHLPDTPWRTLVEAPGYSLGFVIVILGRQQLFTESTLTAMLPLMLRRDRETLFALLRMWALVLASNLVGTIIFAALISRPGLFPDTVHDALGTIGHEVLEGAILAKFIKAVLAGWLIAMMVWLLPSARSARILVIMLLTYVVGIGQFPHVIAGSADAAFAVFSGAATIRDYALDFLLPTLAGNTVGGVALVAFLNHAPLAPELRSDA